MTDSEQIRFKTAVVIPNWNGADMILDCLASLTEQTQNHTVVLVDNASVDNSVEVVEQKYPGVVILRNDRNLGFAGGVNMGIRYALKNTFDAVALLNNDAVADKMWLEQLVKVLEDKPSAGIVTGKVMSIDKSHFDTTGDTYTTWGIPYPRARGETVSEKYDKPAWVFSGTGGASLYRSEMLKKIGLFDEDFFAYYEDVDISFRAQLAGWRVRYVPEAVVYHATSSTGSKIPGFFTYQTIKNYPWLFWKNVPRGLFLMMVPRFTLAYTFFLFKGLFTPSRTIPTIKGLFMCVVLFPRKLSERWKIQESRTVSDEYIKSMLTWDLPPNANKLRSLRSFWWRIVGKS